MPDTTLSAAIKEAYASAPSAEVILHTLEFRHPAFVDELGQPTALRVVRDHANLIASLEVSAPIDPGYPVLFLAYPFDLIPPSVEQGASPEVVITVDNVSAEIERNLSIAVSSPYLVEVTYRAYLASDTSTPQNDPPMTLTVTQVEATDFRITCRASFGDLANRQFPNEDYTVERFPGLNR
jgi:hypothetical protein